MRLVAFLGLLLISTGLMAQLGSRTFFETEVLMEGTGALKVPSGTSLQQPSSPTAGMIRFNTDENNGEIYNGSAWISFGDFGIPLLQKGSLITSNGLLNGEFLACANGQVIEFDDSTPSGLTCSTAVTLTANNVFVGSNTFSNDVTLSGTGQLKLPEGTTAERSGTPANGMIRYNSTDSRIEAYIAGAWTGIGGQGKIDGPGSSVDNTILKFDGTTGLIAQGTGLVVDDSNNVSGINDLEVGNNLTVTGATTLNSSLNGLLNASNGVISGGGAADLTSQVTGTLPIVNGGTNSNTALNNNRVMVSSGGAIVEDTNISVSELATLNNATGNLENRINSKVDRVASNDNRITRFDGVLGDVQDSVVSIDDNGNMTNVNALGVDGVGTFADNINMTGTGAIYVPSGTLGERPAAASGAIRLNTTSQEFEGYNGVAWAALGSGGGGGGSLQGAYNNSADGEIVVDTTRQGFKIRDNATPIGQNLFEVENSAQTTPFFTVNTSGATASNLSVPGTTTLDPALNGIAKITAGVVSAGNLNLTSEVTGTLPIANGGTNSNTALANNLVMVSSGGAIVENSSGVDTTELSYVDGAQSNLQIQIDGKLTAVASTDNAVTRFNGTSGQLQDSGVLVDDADNVSGVNNLTVVGATTLNTGLSGVVKASSGVISASAVDLTADVSGILPIANGGTGSATKNFVDLTNTQTVAGVKTFSDQIDANSGADIEGAVTINSNGAGDLLTLTETSVGTALVVDQNGSGDAVSISGTTVTDSDITMNGTGAIKLPEGTTVQRPTAAIGMLRFNSDLNQFEGYNGAGWAPVGGGFPLLQKGSVISSNGTANGEFLACANGEVLGYNSASSSGLECVAQTTGFTDPMTTRGDLIYRNMSNTTVRLGAGAAGEVLTSDGTDISWQPSQSLTAADIKTLYESNADTNAFNDAEQTKLAGIEASADVTDTANVTAAGAAILAGQAGGQTLNGGTAASENLNLSSTANGTKGNVQIGTPSLITGLTYDETNDRLSVAGNQNDITIAGTTLGSKVSIHAEGNADLAEWTIERHTDTPSFGGNSIYARARGTHAAPTAVQDNDYIARLVGVAYDGTDFEQAAEISYEIDGATGAGDMPGRIVFKTSADGGATPTEALRLSSDQSATFAGLVNGRNIGTDGTKLDGIEAGATADQTDAEIKTAYENNADTNAFTDAEQTKLAGIEASADVTDTANVTAAGAVMDSELTNETAVKAINQGLATTDSPTFVGVTGTLQTAAQPNITSVGTLTGLNSSGAININGAAASRDLNLKGFMNLEAGANTNAWAIYTNSDNSFRMNYNGSGGDEFVMDSSGNVTASTFTGTIQTAAQPNITSVGNLGVNNGATGTAFVEIGNGRTVDGTSFIDLIGDTTFTDYGLRIARNSGSSGGALVTSRGDGVLNVQTEGPGSLALNTNGTNGLIVDGATQNVSIPNGDLTVDTSTLHVDSANNRVGVGTATPGTALEVNGTITGASGEWNSDGMSLASGDAFRINNVGLLTETTLNVNPGASGNGVINIDSANGSDAYMDFSESGGQTALVGIDASAGDIFKLGRGFGVSDVAIDLGNGRVGVGTDSPEAPLHVLSGSSGTFTPGGSFDDMVLEVGGAGGMTIVSPDANPSAIGFSSPSTNNDVAALVRWDYGAAGANQQMIVGTNSAGGNLSLRTGGFAERIAINSAGNVRFNAYGAGTLQTDASGNITVSSDESLKENIEDYSVGLEEVLKLKPVTYNWNEKSGLDTEETYAGFIAQDVEEAGVDHAVYGEDGSKTLTDRAILAALVNSVKELKAENDKLREEINQLKN